MDPGTASVIVSAITATGAIIATTVGALLSSDRAVERAIKPKDELIQRHREQIISLGGDPDAK